LSKFDSAGDFQWARTWGGALDEYVRGVAADDSGNSYVVGWFAYAADFDPGPGVDEHEPVGQYDCFLSAFDPNGDFRWADTWGGSGSDFAAAVAVDSTGNVHVTGWYTYTADFDPGPDVDEHVSAGSDDAFISKFTSAGEFIWARTWGSSYQYATDRGSSVATDLSGNAYVCGFFEGTADFDPDEEVFELSTTGGYDVFLTKLDSSGDFVWARSWGAADTDWGWSVALDGSDNVFATGVFMDLVDFDPGSGTCELKSVGDHDVFLSKFDQNGDFLWARAWGGDYADSGESVATDAMGNSYIAGYLLSDLADLDPGPGTQYYVLKGGIDAFLTMLPPDGDW
jgi:hypothetical protein